MTSAELRQRAPAKGDTKAEVNGVTPSSENDAHPSGAPKHGRLTSLLRAFALLVYGVASSLAIHLTQFLGVPLYLVSKDFYYAYQSVAKASFGIAITTITHWWAPTLIRFSGDASVAGQLSKTPDGRVQCAFPERLVMIANHQIYTDWLYLWWVAYTNSPQMHGHIYIILKESLKWIPVLGPGCMFFSFIFMARKIQTDAPRMKHRLQKLRTQNEPMWLLLFPEGTNLSANGRRKSAAWAEKSGQKDHQHVMIPRSTGTFFCLNELEGSVEYVYDCTVAYEGIPRGKFGEDYFSLSSTFFEGRPPKSVNFHWRRFAVKDIPLDNPETFNDWIRQRWIEKDALMEHYLTNGRFPADEKAGGYIETEVRTEYWWEFIKIFTVLGALGLTFNVIVKTLFGLQRSLRATSA